MLCDREKCSATIEAAVLPCRYTYWAAMKSRLLRQQSLILGTDCRCIAASSVHNEPNTACHVGPASLCLNFDDSPGVVHGAGWQLKTGFRSHGELDSSIHGLAETRGGKTASCRGSFHNVCRMAP